MVEMPTRIVDLFSNHNDKLGDGTLSFSIPTVVTCPGASKLCISKCYARKGRYYFHYLQQRLQRNWEYSRHPDFKYAVTDMLLRRRADFTGIRLHTAGDFYSAAYARKWLYVMQRCPKVQFWFYTRSWRRPAIFRVFEEMAGLAHVHIWFSCDQETGKPKRVPEGVRLAYMMVEHDDNPEWEPDLYFRDYALRRKITKHIQGTMVCPVENGVSHTTCRKCQICLTDPLEDTSKRTKERFSLTVI